MSDIVQELSFNSRPRIRGDLTACFVGIRTDVSTHAPA